MALLYAVSKASEGIKKNRIDIDLVAGDKVLIKTKNKGRFSRKELKGEVISNKKEQPFFIVNTGKSRTSFLKIDAIIGTIEVKKIN